LYKLIEENAHFIVIHKFSGVGFHDEREGEALRPGLVSALKEEFTTLYPVHRLDKVTSGLLLFAKDLNTCQQLNALFATHQIEKYYLAIADKKPRKKQGRISGDMLKARRGAWKLARTKENPALTEFVSTPLGQGLRLFLLRPYTGKTHQLRVAMKSLGAPIIGDVMYGDAQQSLGHDRAYLHALCLRFSLNNDSFEFVSLPENGLLYKNTAFKNAVSEKFSTPWKLDWKGIHKGAPR